MVNVQDFIFQGAIGVHLGIRQGLVILFHVAPKLNHYIKVSTQTFYHLGPCHRLSRMGSHNDRIV